MTWPIENIIRILSMEPNNNSGRKKNTSGANNNNNNLKQGLGAELIVRHLRLITYLTITYLAYQYTWPIEEAKEWKLRWILIVLFRNLFIEFLLYGGWHYFLYESGCIKGRIEDKKFNPENQYDDGGKNISREVIFTTLGFFMSSAFECVILHLWSAKSSYIVPFYDDFWGNNNLKWSAYSIFHVFIVAYWRDGHFYFVHRLMHKWNFKIFGVDIGYFLYKHVHSLHHKSKNPGPWSGLSMHPIEHLFYYSCTLTVLLFPLHPYHFLYTKFHADISPIAGHDGYDKPAGGSAFHYLHHSLVDCNYGTPLVPLDYVFGTLKSDESHNNSTNKHKKK